MAAQGYHSTYDLLATAAVVGLPLTLLTTTLRPAARPRAAVGRSGPWLAP
jgi:hypothetical protein